MYTSKEETYVIPKAAHLIASSKFVSSRMRVGDLPPSSRETFLIFESAAALRTCRPTRVPMNRSIRHFFREKAVRDRGLLPVKATFPIPIWLEMAAPAVLPSPVKTLTTPGGKPASAMSSHIRIAVRGVHSEGLKTMVFPVARAGPSFQDIIQRGKFQGTICPTTPILNTKGS